MPHDLVRIALVDMLCVMNGKISRAVMPQIETLESRTLLTITGLPKDIETLDVGPGERLALVIGAEGSGLSAPALAAAGEWVRIPMSNGVDSLNVAAAAAVAAYALRRRTVNRTPEPATPEATPTEHDPGVTLSPSAPR